VVLANAVRDTKKPEQLLLALAISALIPALAIIGEVSRGVDVTDRKHFLAGLGLQVNEYGTLLASAAGPLLFICAGSGASRQTRVAAGVVLGVVLTSLLLTASRAAAIALIVIVIIWLLRRRRFTDLLIGIAVAALLAAIIPQSIQERLTMGLDDLGATGAYNSNDPLTKGRVQVWANLAPEILESPWLGRGLSSTAWNPAVTTGRVTMMHPHNMYLEILLDLGVLGGAAIAYLFYKYARTMLRLSREPSFSPLLREYFGGAFAAYVGMLCSAVSGEHYMPLPDQTYLWFSLGFCFAYWKLAQQPRSVEAGKPFGIRVKRATSVAVPPLREPSS
jgi:O-antigen ligase